MDLIEKKKEIQDKLGIVRVELLRLIESLPEDKLNTKVSAHDESWTIIEVIRHLKSAEQSMTNLMKAIQSGGEGTSPEFDLDRWNKSQVRKLADKSINDLTKEFIENRIKLLAFLDQLSEKDMQLEGRHGTLNIYSLEKIFNVIADHEKSHIDKIRSAI